MQKNPTRTIFFVVSGYKRESCGDQSHLSAAPTQPAYNMLTEATRTLEQLSTPQNKFEQLQMFKLARPKGFEPLTPRFVV